MEEEEAIFSFSGLFSSLFLSLTILYSIFSYRFFLYYPVFYLFLSFLPLLILHSIFFLSLLPLLSVFYLFLSFLSERDFNVLRERFQL